MSPRGQVCLQVPLAPVLLSGLAGCFHLRARKTWGWGAGQTSPFTPGPQGQVGKAPREEKIAPIPSPSGALVSSSAEPL